MHEQLARELNSIDWSNQEEIYLDAEGKNSALFNEELLLRLSRGVFGTVISIQRERALSVYTAGTQNRLNKVIDTHVEAGFREATIKVTGTRVGSLIYVGHKYKVELLSALTATANFKVCSPEPLTYTLVERKFNLYTSSRV